MSNFLLQNAQRLHQAGNLAEAARLYGEILRLNPNQFEALYPLGVLHFQAGRYADAERLIADAIRLNSRAAEPHYFRGCALQRLNRNEDAIAAFGEALAVRPGFVDALMARGVARMTLNRYEDALEDFDAIIAAEPQNAGAWSNRGCILQGMNRNEDALACFEKASSLKPDFIEALIGGGSVLATLKRFEEAARNYEKVLSLNPDIPYVLGNLALFRLQCCDWSHFDRDRAQIAAGVKAGKPVIQPFINVTLSDSMADQLQCARNSIAFQWPQQSRALWRGERYGHDKIRVAYISADFRDHAVARLVAGLFEHHDRSRFETTGVSLVPDDGSAMRTRLRGSFDHFIDADRQSDEHVASLLRRMDVDIVVDLMGFTSGCRPGILGFRPAPVQVNFLGYPGTMGAPYVDYIVADAIVIPDDHRAFYTEKIVTLPDAYQCNDRRRTIADATPSRADLGLPDGAFVFCCFNNSNKLTPELFTLWMRLLDQVGRQRPLAARGQPSCHAQSAPRGGRPRCCVGPAGVCTKGETSRTSGASSRSRSVPRHASLRCAHHRERCVVDGAPGFDLPRIDLCRPCRRKPAACGGAARAGHELAERIRSVGAQARSRSRYAPRVEADACAQPRHVRALRHRALHAPFRSGADDDA